jgi:NitT/TauT family transport system permease protein
MLIGILVGLSNLGRRSVYPVVLLLYGIPQAIMLPLFVLIFGIGPAVKIAFGFSHGIFPVIVNTLAGMRNVNRLMVTGATAMGATRVQQVRYVIFPHMVATVFAGLRLAMTLTLLGVVLAEIFVAGRHRILHARLFRDVQSGGPDGACLDARSHGKCAQRAGAAGRGALLALEGLTLRAGHERCRR